MKISQGWEQSVYSLLILGCLPKGKVMSSMAMAERLQVSPSYLKKIIKSLVDEGLVKSTPGKHGGFSLVRDLKDITFLDVFSAIEGRGRIFYSQRLLIKFLGKDKDRNESCRVSSAMNYLEETISSTLAATTLDHVLEETKENNDMSDLLRWMSEND